MAQPNPSEEIPGGPNLACENLTVRGSLSVGGGAGIVATDGVTIQGDGSGGSPVAIKAVQHGTNLQGNGTVASPLNVANALDQSAVGKSLVVGDMRGTVLAVAVNADQNDWAPAGGTGATVIIATPTGALRAISGLTGGVTGRIVWIVNPPNSGQILQILGESALSVATNRFRPADGNNGASPLNIVQSTAQAFMYDGTRWQGLAGVRFQNLTADLNVTSNGSMNVAGNIATGTISVTTTAQLAILSLFGTATVINANVNDLTPNSFNISTRVDLAPTGAFNITGITGGFGNRVMILQNLGAFNVTLTNEDAASAAANRFQLPGGVNYVLAPDRSLFMYYASGTARWRALLQ